jgi:hypothetical protein
MGSRRVCWMGPGMHRVAGVRVAVVTAAAEAVVRTAAVVGVGRAEAVERVGVAGLLSHRILSCR